MALNDLEWWFRVKSCFAPVCLASDDHATFENNCVKLIKRDALVSAAEIFGRDSSFWQYKVCANIRTGSPDKKAVLSGGKRAMPRLFFSV